MDDFTRSPFGQAATSKLLFAITCPFQFSGRVGFAAALERYRREPTAGADAIYLEAVSLAFNDRVGLLAKGRLIDAVRQAGLTEVIRQYQDRVRQ